MTDHTDIKLLSIEDVEKIGNFYEFNVKPIDKSIKLNSPEWHTYYIKAMYEMNKEFQLEDCDPYRFAVFVNHWKRDKYGYLIVDNISDIPYYINSVSPINHGNSDVVCLECEIKDGDEDGDDTEIHVFVFYAGTQYK